jgi:hypothetical protein
MNSKFDQDGYIVIRNLIPKELLTFAKRYYRMRQGSFDYTVDEQIDEGISFYADYFCETMLLEYRKKIEQAIELDLIPTYSYSRIYFQGAELKKHRDRPECSYSATICLATPEGFDIEPIYMSKTENGIGSSVLLNEGDACIYKGCDIYHWRDKQKNPWLVQSFLHYASAQTQRHLLFDGRPQLGWKKSM